MSSALNRASHQHDYLAPHLGTVLFLCPENSANSILAESLLMHLGKDWIRVFSAGNVPNGKVNPLALEMLASRGLPTSGLRSKSWAEFIAAGAPEMDVIVHAYDAPIASPPSRWPGNPVVLHWRMRDPATVEGSHELQRVAFENAFLLLESNIARLVSIMVTGPDSIALQNQLSQTWETVGSRQAGG